MNDINVTAPSAETATIKYEQAVPDVLAGLAAVHGMIAKHDLEPKLVHLVLLRASQMNRCAFCIKMHTKEARQDGETNDRLDRLIVWEHVRDFTDREKAAFAWTEALTALDGKTDYAALRGRLRRYFSESQIGALTSTIGMINLWNRLQVSNH